MPNYLLDTNIYLNFYERYYKFNIFPSFWSSFIPVINNNVVIPKVVIDENYQDMSFKDWIGNNYSNTILNHKVYARDWLIILEHLRTCGYYKDAALDSDRGWANERIADAWLVAIAKKEGFTIVTDEKRNPNLLKGSPSKAAKIPDICDNLNIRCITMNQFFQEVGLVI